MKRITSIVAVVLFSMHAIAQQTLTLDSCRAMAIRSNKQLSAAKLKKEAAELNLKSAKTNSLPKIDAIGGYQYSTRSVSLLNNGQKNTLTNLGSGTASLIGSNANSVITDLVSQGLMSPEIAQGLGSLMGEITSPIVQYGNQLGQTVNKAFETNTHNIFAGAIMLRQPIYTGGALTAMNRIAEISSELADNQADAAIQSALTKVDETYWLIVSLKQKQALANAFCNLVKKLDDDVHKMINQGVATYADGLKVDVKVNEAEMAVTTVDNGLSLAKMLLCQQCGLPLDTDIILADESEETISIGEPITDMDNETAHYFRSELRLLQNAIDLSNEATNLIAAAYRPQVALTAGYMFSNPNTFNGFTNTFGGTWNVGVLVRVPLWNWHDGEYKIRASKTASAIAQLELEEAKSLIDLQIEQSRFKLSEAIKRLTVAKKNMRSAEENLRCANVGFREGVIESTEVMAAQTAWQAAQMRKIDAEVDVKLSQVNLKRALGAIEF